MGLELETHQQQQHCDRSQIIGGDEHGMRMIPATQLSKNGANISLVKRLITRLTQIQRDDLDCLCIQSIT